MLYTYYNFKLFLFAENLEFVKDYLNFKQTRNNFKQVLKRAMMRRGNHVNYLSEYSSLM